MLMLLAATLATAVPAGGPAGTAPEVRRMIRDVNAFIARHGEPIWPGYAARSVRVILVADHTESLFCADHTRGFHAAGVDPITGCSVQTRPRTFPTDLAATMGFQQEPAMVVIGLPRTLGQTRAQWMLTLAHEAFHHYQHRLPGYADTVAALGLAGTSVDGSWMLDYPFPYADPPLGKAMDAMAANPLAFLAADTTFARRQAVGRYLVVRRTAAASVTPKQWRYYEFQVGHEGVARWTEHAVAAARARRDRTLAQAAADQWASVANSLKAVRAQGIAIWKRAAFYALGAVEADMLDKMGEDWRPTYRTRPFKVGEQLEHSFEQRSRG